MHPALDRSAALSPHLPRLNGACGVVSACSIQRIASAMGSSEFVSISSRFYGLCYRIGSVRAAFGHSFLTMNIPGASRIFRIRSWRCCNEPLPHERKSGHAAAGRLHHYTPFYSGVLLTSDGYQSFKLLSNGKFVPPLPNGAVGKTDLEQVDPPLTEQMSVMPAA